MARKRVMVSEQFITFDTEGVTYEGKFERLGNIQVEGREVKQYSLTNGRAKMVFNGTMNLDTALENVQDGEDVEILYEGSTDIKDGKTVKGFKVWILTDEEEEGPTDGTE